MSGAQPFFNEKALGTRMFQGFIFIFFTLFIFKLYSAYLLQALTRALTFKLKLLVVSISFMTHSLIKKKVVPCLRIFFLLDEETSSGNWRRERNAHGVVRKKKPSKGGEKKGRYRILTGELWINFEIDTKERWCSRQLYCTCSLLDHRSMKLLLVLFSPDPSLLGWNACPSQCTSLLCSQ